MTMIHCQRPSGMSVDQAVTRRAERDGKNIYFAATDVGKWHQLFHFEWSDIMKRFNLRNTLDAALLIVGTILCTNALADTQQSGYTMGTGMMSGYGFGWMGGYGGMWLPILLVIVIIALVAWIVTQKKK